MKRNRKLALLISIVILASLFFTACKKEDIENKMYGAWNISTYFSNEDILKLSEEPLPEGMKMEITLKGTQTYHRGGKYSGEAEWTLRYFNPDGEVSLRFFVKDAGEWSLHSDGLELVETSTGSSNIPLDEITASFLKEVPEFTTFINSVKGETWSSKIVSITDTSLQLELDDPKIRMTLTKK
jgi:hypothetical protein